VVLWCFKPYCQTDNRLGRPQPWLPLLQAGHPLVVAGKNLPMRPTLPRKRHVNASDVIVLCLSRSSSASVVLKSPLSVAQNAAVSL
jgi:hypothetical protein